MIFHTLGILLTLTLLVILVYKVLNNCHVLTTFNATWIINLGASNHMFHDKSLLVHICKLDRPHSITLPNGHRTHAFEFGTTFITDNVILNNVLHVSVFHYNLQFIRILCKQFNSFVVFSYQYCFLMHGSSLKRSLILGKHQVGLYIFQSRSLGSINTALSIVSDSRTSSSSLFFIESLCDVVSTHDIVTLCHKHLGNLPLYRLKTLSFMKIIFVLIILFVMFI